MRQVAAVEDQVGRGLAQIREDRLERGSIPVDIGYDGDAHDSNPVPWHYDLTGLARWREARPQRIAIIYPMRNLEATGAR